MKGPDLMPGAPQATVWVLGFLFILLLIALLAVIAAMAVSVYDDAKSRGAPALAWCIATIVGGWLTALAWMVFRDRYSEDD